MSSTSFKPAWWLPGPHLQTLWGALIRRNQHKGLQITRERIELSDGDFIDLDWTGQKGQPIVVILHGLEGSAQSSYAHGLLKVFSQHKNWRAVVMHFRGCSGEQNRLPRFYHSGDTADLNTVINLLRERELNMPISAVGVSMGGNVLLKWLGETGRQNPLVAAVAVSTPFELRQSVLRLRNGFSRVYDRHLLNRLRKKINEKFSMQVSPIALPTRKSLRTVNDFDELVTAPLHGFQNANDYYEKSSSRQFIKFIKIPTLLLQAKDDPFMFPDVIPKKDELSPSVILEATDQGGHVGFVMGKFPWRPCYWLEQRIPEFLELYLRSS